MNGLKCAFKYVFIHIPDALSKISRPLTFWFPQSSLIAYIIVRQFLSSDYSGKMGTVEFRVTFWWCSPLEFILSVCSCSTVEFSWGDFKSWWRLLNITSPSPGVRLWGHLCLSWTALTEASWQNIQLILLNWHFFTELKIGSSPALLILAQFSPFCNNHFVTKLWLLLTVASIYLYWKLWCNSNSCVNLSL